MKRQARVSPSARMAGGEAPLRTSEETDVKIRITWAALVVAAAAAVSTTAGCSSAESRAKNVTPQSFAADPSKVPPEMQLRIQSMQQKGAAQAAQKAQTR